MIFFADDFHLLLLLLFSGVMFVNRVNEVAGLVSVLTGGSLSFSIGFFE